MGLRRVRRNDLVLHRRACDRGALRRRCELPPRPRQRRLHLGLTAWGGGRARAYGSATASIARTTSTALSRGRCASATGPEHAAARRRHVYLRHRRHGLRIRTDAARRADLPVTSARRTTARRRSTRSSARRWPSSRSTSTASRASSSASWCCRSRGGGRSRRRASTSPGCARRRRRSCRRRRSRADPRPATSTRSHGGSRSGCSSTRPTSRTRDAQARRAAARDVIEQRAAAVAAAGCPRVADGFRLALEETAGGDPRRISSGARWRCGSQNRFFPSCGAPPAPGPA